MILKSCIWKPVHFVAPLPSKRSTPKAIVLHTNAIRNGPASLFGNYDARARDPNSSEHLQVAHIQVALDGTAEQYADTDVILGLTWDANPFSVGVETQDGDPVDSQPWTDAQVAKFIEIARELKVPARVLPENGAGGGVGYHQEYGSWNQSTHNCPGKARRAQVQKVIDGLKAKPPKEDDLTHEQDKKLNFINSFLDNLGEELIPGYVKGADHNADALAKAVADALKKAAGP